MVSFRVVSKICNRTTCHGIPDWYNTSNVVAKGTWTIVLLGALAAIALYSYQMVLSYMKYETATRISEVRLNEMPFPNVTVCYSGRLNNTYVRQNIHPAPSTDPDMISEQFPKYLLALAYQNSNISTPDEEYLDDTYQYNFNSTINPSAIDILTFLNDSSYQCQQFFYHCAFILGGFPCCDNARPVWSDYGMCYQMKLNNRDENDHGRARQLAAGQTFGFEFTLITPVDDTEGDGESGLRVHFTGHLEPDDRDSVLLAVGQHSRVRLNPTVRVVDPSLGSCSTQPDPLAYHDTYTTGLCHNECTYNASMEMCGCAPVGYEARVSPEWVCTPSDMLHCVIPMVTSAQTNRDTDKLWRCYEEYCRRLCSIWDYAPSVSYTGLAKKDTDTRQTITTQVTIYFGELQYLQIEQQPLTTFEEFICNLGGMWGFWTGISVVALLQCLYIMLCGEFEDD